MPKNIQNFSDLDLDFKPHPLTGDIVPLTNNDAVKQSVKNLIYTAAYERPFNYGTSSGIKQLLFEQITPVTSESIRIAIQDVLNSFEPRITLIRVIVNVNADYNGYIATIIFSIDEISAIEQVNIFLERAR